jgi:hypothetical protein
MHENSPWYWFHRDSPGWLYLRHRRGEHISANDVARILDANPGFEPDNLFQSYIDRASQGELKGKRGPRKSAARELRLLCAALIVEELAPRLTRRKAERARRGIRKRLSHFSPTERAQAVAAKILRYGCWETLRNRLSLQRTHQENFVSAAEFIR